MTAMNSSPITSNTTKPIEKIRKSHRLSKKDGKLDRNFNPTSGTLNNDYHPHLSSYMETLSDVTNTPTKRFQYSDKLTKKSKQSPSKLNTMNDTRVTIENAPWYKDSDQSSRLHDLSTKPTRKRFHIRKKTGNKEFISTVSPTNSNDSNDTKTTALSSLSSQRSSDTKKLNNTKLTKTSITSSRRSSPNENLNITKQSTPLSNKPKQHSSSKVIAEYSKLSAALPSNDPLDTPLHVACTIGGFSENFIIHHILKSNPQYASRKNSNGNLPLHCAILNPNGLTLKLMDSLLASYPSSVYELNSESCLPIHLLCQRRTYDIEVLKRLLELHPSSVTMQCKLSIGTSNKNIQKAEYTSQDEDLTDYYYCFGLIYNKGNKNPTSKTQISPNDEYRSSETDFSPLHLACLNGAPTEVINLIISTNVLCLSVKTSLGRTALDCVKAYGESLKETQPNKNDS